MWSTNGNLPLRNENLKNTIFKQTKVGSSNDSFLRTTQLLSETNMSYEMPIYLLNLWISHYHDASEMLKKTTAVFYLTGTENKNYYLNSNTINNSISTLSKKLKDFESIFEYYLGSTHEFFSKDPINRFRKSPLKNVENLKFVPLNLHVEQFLVEKQNRYSQLDNDLNPIVEKSSYEFTSAGAFTTCHTNKLNLVKPIEFLMMHDKPFEFNNNASSHLIENETVLNFYALKLFIQISNELIQLKEQNFDENKLKSSIESLKSNLGILLKTVIESYDLIIDQYTQLVLIEKKQHFYNLKEKIDFYKNKLAAFLIEIDSFILNRMFDKFDSLFQRLAGSIIELYSVLLNDAIGSKFDFVNNSASLCQALTAFVASIDLKYYKNSNTSDLDFEESYNFHVKNGILFHVESVLSCFSNEFYMVYDHYNALQNFNYVYLHLPANRNDLKNDSNFFIFIDIQRDGFHIYLYTSYESATNPIRVYPVLVNVGINEQSYTSNFLGENILQKFINTQSILKLRSYYDNLKHNLKETDLRTLEILFNQLRTNKSFVESPRPIELLHKVAEISRILHSIRLTNCKSGKDRTGVSVSLEQCMLLVRNHEMPNDMLQSCLDDFRRNGTRLDVVKKNIGHGKYAFSKIRYFLLPKLYRPPADLCDELET